jgi:hypothetical protein
LRLRLIQRHFLHENRLGQDVQGIWAAADRGFDQRVGLAVDVGCGRLSDPLGQAVDELLVVFVHRLLFSCQ